MVLDKYSANFLFTLWKRVRKYGACCTGLTQNVDDLLQSHTAQTMLANSEFLVMLNQASTDRLELARLLNISDCWVSVKQFSKNDTATACQDWLRSTRLGRGSIKSHVRTVKVLGMGLFAFQERIHLWKGVTH